MTKVDEFSHFLRAQETVYPDVLEELRSGRKRSHWMWFIFPQIAGLGRSPMARQFALSSLDEARRFLAHPVLGPRLRECTRAVLAHAGPDAGATPTAYEIFGSPDELKFHSSMTLFHRADPNEALFPEALRAFYAGEPDQGTLSRI